jgi:hypothetical protein
VAAGCAAHRGSQAAGDAAELSRAVLAADAEFAALSLANFGKGSSPPD